MLSCRWMVALTPDALIIAVPFFGQGEPEHVTVEGRGPLGLAGDKDDSGDKPHIFRAL